MTASLARVLGVIFIDIVLGIFIITFLSALP